MEFEFEGTTYQGRHIQLVDIASLRFAIKQERYKSLPGNTSVDIMAQLAAQPVTNNELLERVVSIEGQAFLLYHAVNSVDQRFTKEMADRMVMADHPFVLQLMIESGMVGADFLPQDEKTSTPSTGDPGKSTD